MKQVLAIILMHRKPGQFYHGSSKKTHKKCAKLFLPIGIKSGGHSDSSLSDLDIGALAKELSKNKIKIDWEKSRAKIGYPKGVEYEGSVKEIKELDNDVPIISYALYNIPKKSSTYQDEIKIEFSAGENGFNYAVDFYGDCKNQSLVKKVEKIIKTLCRN